MAADLKLLNGSVECHPAVPQGWDSYVDSHPQASVYHDSRWTEVIRRSFRHTTYFLFKRDITGIKGVLPLVYINSHVFGKALVSMPYFNYGGLLADNFVVAEQLVGASVELKKIIGADYLELRQTAPIPGGWPARSHKVIMTLALPSDPEVLWNSFKTKLRTRVRRSEKEGFTVHFGKHELLHDFYQVFSQNMRDLGTPVYPKGFFLSVLDSFPRNCHVVAVRCGSQCIASGFLISHRQKIEVPWASSLRQFNHLSPNMLLYWNMLRYSISLGFSRFDFGRSSPDSGTFAFKEQWGALPQPTFWFYPGKKANELPDHSPQSPKYQWATRVWKRLPLFVTNFCGPGIVRNIP